MRRSEMKKGEKEICQTIMDKIEKILLDAGNIRDAINYADLGVSGVAFTQELSPDGSVSVYYHISIEEASPAAYKLHSYLVDCINVDSFFDKLDIEITTEW
jgi:hypothetical protein